MKKPEKKSDLYSKDGMWFRKDFVSDEWIFRDVYQKDEYKTRLYSGDRGKELVVDAGAHIGSFARLWHEKNPNAVIVCIEANPDNFEVLKKNVGDYAVCINAALTYEEEDIYLFDSVVSGNGFTNSTAISVTSTKDKVDSYCSSGNDEVNGDFVVQEKPLQKITLGQILAKFGFPRIGVLKLDIEGEEYSCLRKSDALYKTKTIFGEWHVTSEWDKLLASSSILQVFNYGEMYRSNQNGIFHLENKENGVEPVLFDGKVENPHYDAKVSKPKIVKVVTFQGIGDCLWVMTKIQSLLKREFASKACIVISGVNGDGDYVSDRAVEFVKNFDFISGVEKTHWSITEDPPRDCEGHWRYSVSQPGWHHYDWMMQANSHLEHGNRLEDWMPDLEINWNVMDHFKVHDSDVTYVKENLPEKYFLIYFGNVSGNTVENHNRGPRWTPEHWVELIENLPDIPLIAIGAYYDAAYFNNYINPLLKNRKVESRIGDFSITRTVEVIRASKGLIAFQSGLGCISGLLGVPTCMWWRKKGDSISKDWYISYEEEENGAFVPKEMLESGKYIPAIYPGIRGMTESFPWTPKKIAERIKRDWLVFNKENL